MPLHEVLFVLQLKHDGKDDEELLDDIGVYPFSERNDVVPVFLDQLGV